MTIKVIVATHKEYKMPQGKQFSAYVPMMVGSSNKESPMGYLRDDYGDNISELNANYSELTGLYNLWKNFDVEVKGIVHYRRYLKGNKKLKKSVGAFDRILNSSEIVESLNKYDAILPSKRNYYVESNESHYVHAHHEEPLDIVTQIIQSDFPDYAESYYRMLKSHEAHMFNMFIMKSEYFDKYCEWLFSILFKAQTKLDLSDYSVQESRVFGFLSELLLDVWISKNKIRYTERRVYYVEGQHVVQKTILFVKRWLFKQGNSHVKSKID